MPEKVKKRDIWNDSLREQLYTLVVWEFGPLKYWETKSRPHRSGGAFKAFLVRCSDHFNLTYGLELSPDAIKSQINYVLQRPKEAVYNHDHKDNFSSNIKAAVRARFITVADLKKRMGNRQAGIELQPERPDQPQQPAPQQKPGDQQQRIRRPAPPAPVGHLAR